MTTGNTPVEHRLSTKVSPCPLHAPFDPIVATTLVAATGAISQTHTPHRRCRKEKGPGLLRGLPRFNEIELLAEMNVRNSPHAWLIRNDERYSVTDHPSRVRRV